MEFRVGPEYLKPDFGIHCTVSTSGYKISIRFSGLYMEPSQHSISSEKPKYLLLVGELKGSPLKIARRCFKKLLHGTAHQKKIIPKGGHHFLHILLLTDLWVAGWPSFQGLR